MSKARLSVSVDADLVEAAEASVSKGRSKTLSAWVNDALRLKAEHDRRIDALASFIEAYEGEHGEITGEEMRTAARRARARAVPARAVPTPKRSSKRAGRR